MADGTPVEWSEWWIPGHPETRVHGALTFDRTDGARVVLADALPDVHAAPFPAATLQGEAIGGKALTLLAPMVVHEQRELTQTRAWSHTTIEAPTQAARQPAASAIASTKMGEAAHPRLPESPCTENAWPRREVETRRFSSV